MKWTCDTRSYSKPDGAGDTSAFDRSCKVILERIRNTNLAFFDQMPG
jgi:hypothetical protein